MEIQAKDFRKEMVEVAGAEDGMSKISFSFAVSSEDYHDTAVLLYKMNFAVRVPELDLEFPAAIQNYATDRTDLYTSGQVADWNLELIEQPR